MSLLVHLGSIFIKILSMGTVKVSGVAGNLNERDGPCG